ncbi:hypothetical protein K443DRAFT_124953 [Laccaria amethystina LaAM-08-1]|uniref:Uncharacterized protein n=1 Tax=Laccaria amethystina LaAM-08-1 TaxID=1095629 RepID=A0A0C9WJR1_9AGAR|nr:hypothetical protein K443DRAFT_124953 [Laccaria amethystina LaAM-08-1]
MTTIITQQPYHHKHSLSASALGHGRFTVGGILCEQPQVFLYRDYQDMVYGLDTSRLTWHMIPNLLIEALGVDAASELIDAFLKQHEAEQLLRQSSASLGKVPPSQVSSDSAELQRAHQVEVIRRMIFRAEKEVELLKQAEAAGRLK